MDGSTYKGTWIRQCVSRDKPCPAEHLNPAKCGSAFRTMPSCVGVHASLLLYYLNTLAMKLGKACLQCREGKRKCEKPSTGEACSQCRARQLHCSSLSRTLAGKAKPLHPGPERLDTHEDLPCRSDIEKVIDLYFWYIHDKPHSLFHEATLRQCVHSGTISRAVLFGILGLASR
jgi:Fungal Zn(2)-Cys(6) binuclear cluster domain